MSPQLPQELSRYRILEKIGEGGMGVVHRARDTRLERDVAVKFLGKGLLEDEAARERFRKEALTLSRLNHPHIATVHDFDRQDDVDYLVMEYIPGKTLDEKLQGNALSMDETLDLGVELAEGLAAAHGEGVLHRDLKPGNLRITPDGRLKILDFGLAKLMRTDDQATTFATVTNRDEFYGTLRYTAPERFRGEQADSRSDIYATGAVLYEMATGRPAFSQPSVPAMIAAVLEQIPQPPSVLNPDVSSGLEGVILKCLEKDPARRYSTADELLAELRRLTTTSEAASPASRPGEPPQEVSAAAREACERGRARWKRRTRQSVETAINFFQQAIDHDSSCATAYAGLADAYATVPYTLETYGSMPFEEWCRLEKGAISKALGAAGRALELDNNLAPAHATKGRVLRCWNMAEGEREFRRSLTLDRSYMWSHVWYSGLLAARGDHEEAIAEAELAVSLGPDSQPANMELAIVLAHARHYDRAIVQLEKTIAMNPSWPEAHRWLMFVYSYLERYEEAIVELRRWHDLVHRDAERYVPIFQAMIDRKCAEQTLSAIEAYQRVYGPFRAAELFARVGESGRALEALERAQAMRDSNLPRWVTLSPSLSCLHTDPRFGTIVDRLGLSC